MQALRWQASDSNSGGVGNTESSAQQPKQQIKITLPDASYKAAAMAVLPALYLVKPVHELLGELTQQQLLQATELADMWEVAMACSTAVEILTAAANRVPGLKTSTIDLLLAMTAVPDCLQPLPEHALISRFGHLEKVLDGGDLEKRLVGLPLHVVELLLSSDKLTISTCQCRTAVTFMILCSTQPPPCPLEGYTSKGMHWKRQADTSWLGPHAACADFGHCLSDSGISMHLSTVCCCYRLSQRTRSCAQPSYMLTPPPQVCQMQQLQHSTSRWCTASWRRLCAAHTCHTYGCSGQWYQAMLIRSCCVGYRGQSSSC